MKNHLTNLVVLGLLTTMSLYSCIQSTAVGAELFEGDKLNVQFSDTLSIRCLTEKTDSVAVYIPGAVQSSYFCGNMVDPSFGRQELMVFTQLANLYAPSLAGVVYDSAVLVLPYDVALTRIDSATSFQLDVHQLTENPDSASVIYSNKKYAYNTVPIASKTFVPNVTDSFRTIVDTTLRIPYLSVRINDAFGRRLLDTNEFPLSPSYELKNRLKGICIKSNGTTDALLAFNFNSNHARLHVFYHKDTSKLRLDYMINQSNANLGLVSFNHIHTDYNNTLLQEYLGSQQKGDSLIFLQGLSGPNVQLELPYVRNLEREKIAINKAELEFVVNEKDGTRYAPLEQLSLYYVSAGGTPTFISDFTTAQQLSSSTGPFPYFGGVPTQTTTATIYRMNLTEHLQEMMSGKRGSIMNLTALNKVTKTKRVILYGPGTTGIRRPRIRITYTKL